jgi:hypothetical protein
MLQDVFGRLVLPVCATSHFLYAAGTNKLLKRNPIFTYTLHLLGRLFES